MVGFVFHPATQYACNEKNARIYSRKYFSFSADLQPIKRIQFMALYFFLLHYLVANKL